MVFMIREVHSGLWCDSSKRISFDVPEHAMIYTNNANAVKFAKDMRDRYRAKPTMWQRCQYLENEPFEIEVVPFRMTQMI